MRGVRVFPLRKKKIISLIRPTSGEYCSGRTVHVEEPSSDLAQVKSSSRARTPLQLVGCTDLCEELPTDREARALQALAQRTTPSLGVCFELTGKEEEEEKPNCSKLSK